MGCLVMALEGQNKKNGLQELDKIEMEPHGKRQFSNKKS